MTHIQGTLGIEVKAQIEAMAKVLYWAWRTSNDQTVKDDSVDAWWPMVGNNQPISRSEWLEMAEAALSFSTPPAAPVRGEGEAVERSIDEWWDAGGSRYPDEAFRAGWKAALSASPSPVDSRDGRLPDDIIERLLAVGPVEWGTSLYQTDEKHVEDLRDTLRITREYFGTEAKETAIHGVYLEGTNTVLAHTGNSPNSPQHARILVGAWNQLVDLALAAKEQQP